MQNYILNLSLILNLFWTGLQFTLVRNLVSIKIKAHCNLLAHHLYSEIAYTLHKDFYFAMFNFLVILLFSCTFTNSLFLNAIYYLFLFNFSLILKCVIIVLFEILIKSFWSLHEFLPSIQSIIFWKKLVFYIFKRFKEKPFFFNLHFTNQVSAIGYLPNKIHY